MDNITSGSNAIANTNSSLAIRSNRGCWTCRIRKKKCDELQPGCLRCADVNVECRYGPKPKWIDDPKFGKVELERIKAIVAASASKKRAAFRARKISNSTSSSLLKSPKSSSSTKSPRKESNLSSIDNVVSKSSDMEMIHDKTIESKSSLFPKWIEDQEASLMMHYLDHVFFIQFRFHTPSLSSGRGWLLSLLIRTKPLYHAALSLSAFHRQSLLLEQESGQAEIDYLHELRHHHDLTLKELRNFIETNNKNVSEQDAFDGNIQILACMIQLISFELFHGGVSNWQVHLRAASELILILHEVSNGSIPNSERSLTSSQCFNYPYAHSPESNTSGNTISRDSAALDFFTGVIIWMDALSCVSTGSHPWLSEFHNRLLSAKKSNSSNNASPSKSDHKIQLTSIMGCENWAMIIISEIAWLATWRRKHQEAAENENENESINFREQLFTTEQNIRTRLESKNSEIVKDLTALRELHHGAPHYLTHLYNKHTICIITHIFSTAALIYLQMAVKDTITREDIDIFLYNTMNALRMIPDPQMLRGLVWPLAIAGCMASSEVDREFFRGVMGDGSGRGGGRWFGNLESVERILERSWVLQSEAGGRLVDCRRTIGEMGVCVLLV